MTPEEQRIKIAEACGWRLSDDLHNRLLYFRGPKNEITEPKSTLEFAAKELPDYLNDLNAMHEAERMLTTENAFKYSLTLGEVCMIPRSFPNSTNWHYYWRQLHATAAQRAEAFLKTLNLWTE